ncbi:MAG: hypothetical protein IJC34_01530, partial [Lentisphaeria bacterium]|nr:hypothetical protein [Lentisphaeria bacterium]
DAINIGILAQRLTGIRVPESSRITDVFPPPDFITKEVFAAMPEEMQDYFTQSHVFVSGKIKE